MATADLRRKVTRQLMSRLVEHEYGFKRNTVRLLIGLAVFYLIYLFCAGDYGLLRIHRLTDERDGLEREYREIVAEAADYDYGLRRLEADPHFVEWMARSRFGYSRPGETIYHLKLPRH